MSRPTSRPWLGRSWRTLVELVLAVGIIAGDTFGIIPLTSTPFLLALAWISLRLRGQRWREIGFARPRNWVSALALGTAAGVAMELLSVYGTVPLLSRLTGAPPDLSDLRSMVGDLRFLAAGLLLSWTLAAVGEEVAYRGYLMRRFADLFGDGWRAWLMSLVVVSALFGWGHGGQGLTGVLQESFAGFLLGLLFHFSGRNLVVPIIAHGVANSVACFLIFLDRYPGV